MSKKNEKTIDTTNKEEIEKNEETKVENENEKAQSDIENQDEIQQVNMKEKKEISIDEIKEKIEEKRNLPQKEIEKINQYLFHNTLVAICVIIYFIFLNLGQMNIQKTAYITDLKVFSVCILILAIILIEKAYKQDSGKIAIFGIEMIVLSLLTVALIYINLIQPVRYPYIVTSISYIFAIYYLVKAFIIYLKMRKKYFVDDMKEMINNKEEKE